MSQSSFPGWATMGDNPSQSSIASDGEASPIPGTPPSTIRKRKNSSKVAAPQRKRPKAIHSATQPADATKHVSISSNRMGKGKQRQKSLESSSEEPQFDFLSAEFGITNSQQVPSTSVSASAPQPADKAKWARKSTGTVQAGHRSVASTSTSMSASQPADKGKWARKPTGSKSKSTRNLATSSASVSAPPQANAKKKPTVARDESIEIADIDVPVSRRSSKQAKRAPSPEDIIIIDSDSDSSSLRTKSGLTDPPPGFRYVNDVFELISSDEEEAVPLVSTSSRERLKSPLPSVPSLGEPAEGAQRTKSPSDELDVIETRLSPAPPPAMDLDTPPLSPTQIDMDMDFDFGRIPSSQPLLEPNSGQRQVSPLRSESPAPEPSFVATSEPKVLVPVEAPDETQISPTSVQPSVIHRSESFGSPSGPLSTVPAAVQPFVSMDVVAPSVPPTAPPVSIPASTRPPQPGSPAYTTPRLPTPAKPSTEIAEPSSVVSENTILSPPAAVDSPPVTRPSLSQTSTEPSAPTDSLSGRIFEKPSLSKVRSLSLSSSSNTLASSSRASQSSTFTAAWRDPKSIDKEPIATAVGLQKEPKPSGAPFAGASDRQSFGKEAVTAPQAGKLRSTVAPAPYRSSEGHSLQDVINRAYKKPPIHIDLTLDEDVPQTVPENVRRNARLLDEFLASEDEERDVDDEVRPSVSSQNVSTSYSPIESLPIRSNSPESPAETARNAAGHSVPSTKPRTNLDNIRSLIKKRQNQTKKTTNIVKSGNETTVVASLPPLPSPTAPLTSDVTAQSAPVPASSASASANPDSGLAVHAVSSHEVGDEHMEDLPTMGDLPSVVPESESTHNENIISAPKPAGEDASEDEVDRIRTLRPRKQSNVLTRTSLSPDSEEVAFDLMYPEDEGVAIPSPLKYEIARRSSSDASPPPLSTRTSSRLSSRSSGSSSGDLMVTMEDKINDDIDIAEPQSGTANDSPYITWESVRRAARERTPKFLKAQDLPHTLQDYLNAMPAMYRKTDEARLIFEAAIRESTIDDEPDAPPIEIHNKIDDEVTPPWEFHYTNKMWHGEGVPGPDMKSLRGCDCEGRCDPKSKTCLCMKKQSKYLDRKGFVYNDKGRLINPVHYPIFECNDFCGCGEECQNRVVQHGRKCVVNIVKTAEKGWGVFAGPKKIPAGTFVGIYSGELLCESVSHERGLKYDIFGRTYLFNIDGYHLQQDDPSWEVSYVVDAYHAGNFTRFLNHSCEPNCMITFCYINEGDKEKPLVVVFTQQDVEPWGELSFSYSGVSDEDIAFANRSDEGAVYAKCLCGAPGCRGVMFK